MFKRAEITMTFSVDLDAVPGWGHTPEDWIALIKREFCQQSHYNTEARVDVVTVKRKELQHASL
jgi:hypothetical protein